MDSTQGFKVAVSSPDNEEEVGVVASPVKEASYTSSQDFSYIEWPELHQAPPVPPTWPCTASLISSLHSLAPETARCKSWGMLLPGTSTCPSWGRAACSRRTNSKYFNPFRLRSVLHSPCLVLLLFELAVPWELFRNTLQAGFGLQGMVCFFVCLLTFYKIGFLWVILNILELAL